MKNVLVKLLLVGVFWCASDSSRPEGSKNFSIPEIAASDSSLSFKNGVLWRNSQPFSGVLVESYPNGQVKSKSEYQDGQKHGAGWMWYPTGEIYWKRNYQNGEKHGVHRGWWPNGQIKFLYHFVNGRYDGDAQEWYENGQLAKSQHYVQSVEVGQQQAWRENGKLYVNYVMKNGKRYGLFNSRLCYKIKDGLAQY